MIDEQKYSYRSVFVIRTTFFSGVCLFAGSIGSIKITLPFGSSETDSVDQNPRGTPIAKLTNVVQAVVEYGGGGDYHQIVLLRFRTTTVISVTNIPLH